MAMTIPQAIEELKHQKAALDRHIAKGATYCDDYTEALGMAIKALKKEMPRALHNLDIDYGRCPFCKESTSAYDDHCRNCGQAIGTDLTDCVSRSCADCRLHKADGPVCPRYADKVDEIRRIHEEG